MAILQGEQLPYQNRQLCTSIELDENKNEKFFMPF